MRMDFVGLPTMFACDQINCVNDAFYATTWAVFTYLKNMHAGQFARFEQLLAGHQYWRLAWEEAFPELSPATLERELQTWHRTGSYKIQHYQVQFREYPVAERELDDADIHAIRGLLAPQADERAEVAAARRLDPTHVLANLLANFHDKKLEAYAARAVAAAHPKDWRAWWLLANVLRSGPQAEQASGKACRLAASNPAIWLPDGTCPRSAAGTR
jgi:hypothetical protein